MKRSLFQTPTRWLPIALLVAAPLGVAGCAAGTPNPNSGAVVVVYPGRELQMATGGDFDIRRVDPAFTAAVAAYAAEVQRLQSVPEVELDMRIRRAMRLLALAVERIPGAQGNDLLPVGTQAIRSAEVTMALASTDDRAYGRSAASALQVTANVLGDIARARYEQSPLVIGRAAKFHDRVAKLGDPDKLRTRQDDLVDALMQAGLVLTAMHTAVARGVVHVAEPMP